MSLAWRNFAHQGKIGVGVVSTLLSSCAFFFCAAGSLAQENTAAPQELVLKYVRPFATEGIFTIVNGEQTGYIQVRLRSQLASVFAGGYVPLDVYAESLNPQLSGRAHLALGAVGVFAVQVKTEVSDPNGKKNTVKSLKVLRAGPGEQIGVGISIISTSGLSAQVGAQVEYYTDEGTLVGRTSWTDAYFQQGRRDAKSLTFRKADLTEH